ncbi:voltage-dependent anion-selective channel [Holotrichia oblita]|uniref:Voltage-dependent anion-selective channel n=1 Tax=Holotrichia oblita TaxID=644536 RepID=A0ACB9STQ4_HOLOL|nr:voltage-dependent anion-selective channel [Holotrichia oblita]
MDFGDDDIYRLISTKVVNEYPKTEIRTIECKEGLTLSSKREGYRRRKFLGSNIDNFTSSTRNLLHRFKQSKTGHLKTSFQNENVAFNADMDVDRNGPLIQASAVIGYQGWLAGYQTAFDTQNKKLTKNNFALGFTTGDLILHTNVDDGQEFGGSIYQRVSPRLETGVQLAWSSGSNNTRFGIGAKYDLDKDAAIRAKVNNTSQIGLGYQQRLRDGITLTLSTLIDGKNFNSGGHKIGLALELEA